MDAIVVPGLDVGAGANQAIDELDVILLNGPVQRSRAVGLRGVHVGLPLDHRQRGSPVAGLHRVDERTGGASSRGAFSEKHVQHVAVTPRVKTLVLLPTLSVGIPARSSNVSSRFASGVRSGYSQVLPTLDLAAPAAHDHRRQRELVVRVAVAHVASVQQDRVIQHRAVAVGHVGKLADELRERLAVVGLDLDQLLLPGLVVLMVRERMECVRHADVVVGDVAPLASHHEAEDPW